MSKLLAGFGETHITPPVGHRMGGHFYEVVSEGVLHPLMARALVLQQGEAVFAMAFADVVSLSPNVTQPVRQCYSQLSGLPVGNVVVSAIHSHTGPLFDDVRYDLLHARAQEQHGGKDPHHQLDYTQFLRRQLLEALVRAGNNLQPVRLSVVRTDVTDRVSFNRRYRMNDGTVEFNPGQLNPNIAGPAGPIDPSLTSIIVRSTDGTPIGGLTIFACHPDTLGGHQFSPDYSYILEQSLRQEFGDNYVSAFMLGTAGDINHIDVSKSDDRKGLAIAERIGTTLGATILNHLPIELERPSLAIAHRSVEIPLHTVTDEEIAAAKDNLKLLGSKDANFSALVQAVRVLDLAKRGPVWPVEVQALRLDDRTAIVSLPGELFAQLGLAITGSSPFSVTAVGTLANDRLTYVPTEQAFEEGSYEVASARVKPGAGEKMVAAAIETLQSLVA